MTELDDYFNNMTKDEIEEFGKEWDADLLLSTLEYHYDMD